MTPVKQEQPTDCFRACIASLLNCPLAQVPDFFAGLPPGEPITTAQMRMVQQSAALLGIYILRLPSLPDEADFAGILWLSDRIYPDLSLILTGMTRKGRYHAVVIRNGRVVHDPADVSQGALSPPYQLIVIALAS